MFCTNYILTPLTVQKRDGNNKEIGCYVKNKGQYIKIEETKKVEEYFK